VIENVVDCSFDLNVTVQGDPSVGEVVLGDTPLAWAAADGYRLELSRRQITLMGAACRMARAGQPLRVSFPCVTLAP
jgi:hypothetical protein